VRLTLATPATEIDVELALLVLLFGKKLSSDTLIGASNIRTGGKASLRSLNRAEISNHARSLKSYASSSPSPGMWQRQPETA
jgi:hypothetical protein